MSPQIRQLVIDNPNLRASQLASLAGVSKLAVIRMKKRLGVNPKWVHKGVGIPFLSFSSRHVVYKVKHGTRCIHQGSFRGVMENVDRLIYCLDNNDGVLPSRRDYYFKGLELSSRATE